MTGPLEWSQAKLGSRLEYYGRRHPALSVNSTSTPKRQSGSDPRIDPWGSTCRSTVDTRGAPSRQRLALRLTPCQEDWLATPRLSRHPWRAMNYDEIEHSSVPRSSFPFVRPQAPTERSERQASSPSRSHAVRDS